MYEFVKEQCTRQCSLVHTYNTTQNVQKNGHHLGLCKAALKGECSYYTQYLEKNHGKKVAQMNSLHIQMFYYEVMQKNNPLGSNISG